MTLRGGYEISPALTPFVEAELGRRIYDQKVDGAGYERSSTALALAAASQLDLGEKLSGEFSAGWIARSFDDDRLVPISGADRRCRPRLVAGARHHRRPGRLDDGRGHDHGRRKRLDPLLGRPVGRARQIRANLTGNAALGLGYRNYAGIDGHDLIFSAEVGATWWLNRYAGLTGRLRHEKLTSNLPGRDYDANSVFLGLKLQR